MRAGDFHACPACGARNKLKWEYCVRCGETLQDVPLGAEAPPAIAEGSTALAAESGGPSVIGSAAALLVLVGAVWYTTTGSQWRAAEPPDPSIFAMATLPPSLPASRAAATPGEHESDYARGMLLMARKDFPGAVALLATAADREPGNALYQGAYGKALWAAGDREQALQRLEVAARLAPGADFELDLAKALDALGRNAEAAQAYEQVLQARPGHEEGLEALGSLYARMGEHAQAVRVLRPLAAARPGDVLATQYLGQALDKTGDLAGAVEAYQKVLSRMPQATVTRGMMAEALFKQGRAEEAVTLLREGIQLVPAAAALHRGLGSVLERAGRPADAAAAYREYAHLAPAALDARLLEQRAASLERVAAASPSS